MQEGDENRSHGDESQLPAVRARTTSRSPLIALLASVLFFVLGHGSCELAPPSPDPEFDCVDPSDCRLWEAGRISGVRIGFHDESGPGGADGELAATEGNAITNHGVSWAALEPTRGTPSASMDAGCAFAAEYDLFQVGFHFVWEQRLLDDTPAWVLGIHDRDELLALLRERVRGIFERCPNLARIDVLNEPLGFLRGVKLYPNHFHQVLGPDYIAQLVRLVREEAPEGAELFVNENFVEYFPERAAAYVALVRELVAAGAAPDAVGLQTHLMIGEPDWEIYRETMEQLAALGVRVFVSELDVPVKEDLADRFSVQAERYRRVVETCLAVPACDTIIVWGITDAHTWLEWFNALTGPNSEPLLFDDFLAPKPAYFAFRDALLRGRGGDHPLLGTRLSLTRLFGNHTLVQFESQDPTVVAPSLGSRNDPRYESSGGATVEFIDPLGEVTTMAIPPGPGWIVSDGHVSYWGNPFAEGPDLWLRIDEGEAIEISAFNRAIAPSDADDGIGVRITIGSLRLCARFASEDVTRRSSFFTTAEEAMPPDGYDCGADAISASP